MSATGKSGSKSFRKLTPQTPDQIARELVLNSAGDNEAVQAAYDVWFDRELPIVGLDHCKAVRAALQLRGFSINI